MTEGTDAHQINEESTNRHWLYRNKWIKDMYKHEVTGFKLNIQQNPFMCNNLAISSWRLAVHTVNMSVLMFGGSMSLVTDSTNTKKAMTMRNRPLINPERISTRPYLK